MIIPINPFIFLLVSLTFSCFIGNAQDSISIEFDNPRLKDYVLDAPEEVEKDFIRLHAYLAKDIEDQSSQVRSFFLWITHNIHYDKEAALAIYTDHRIPTIPETLKSKRAICTGYARLLMAFCRRSSIPCYVIDGYTKNAPSSKSQMEEPDHAWNVVKIDQEWQLIDATWAAGIAQHQEGFPHKKADHYFLIQPQQLLEDHLPSDPMWQLLDSPISFTQFRDSSKQIKHFLTQKKPCYNLLDSLKKFEQLNQRTQQIKSLERAYFFNPSQANAEQLGHTYIDQFIIESEQEEKLQGEENIDTLLNLYPRLLNLAAKAEQYTTLFDWQKENLAYTHTNFAVALSRKLPTTLDDQIIKELLLEMEKHFLKAQSILRELPTSPFIEQGLLSCEEYLLFTRSHLKTD